MKSLVVAVVVVAGCGGEHKHTLSADAQTDAPADGSSNGCDYTEQQDGTNEGTAEATGVTVTSKTTICGTIDASHFDGDITVDVDRFTVSVVSDTDVLVRIAGNLGSSELVGVDIYGGPSLSTRVGANTFYGDHGVTALHLAPGTYELMPFALNSTAIAASVDYKVEITLDSPSRCVELTTGGHAEGNGANDVIAFPSGMPPMLTPATDNAETTNIMLGTSARITGTATDIASQDNYEDRDTFAFATIGTTNEATVKIVGDVDFFVFEANSADPLARGVDISTSVFPLKTGAAYWLTIGARTGTAGLPISYSATLCGATY